MNNWEDEDEILQDIKALEAALAQHSKCELKTEVTSQQSTYTLTDLSQPSSSRNTDIYPSTSNTEYEKEVEEQEQENVELEDEEEEEEEEEEEDGDDDEETNLNALSDPEAALILNDKIIKLLLAAKKRLQLLLAQCRRRQIIVDEKIRQQSADSQSRLRLTIAGIPYFKDKQYFPAPQNEDAKLKARRGELQIISLPYPLRWTLKDRNILWDAIYRNAKSIFSQAQARSRESQDDEMALNTEDPPTLNHKSGTRKISEEMFQNMKHLVGPLGSQEFDWLKIAATDFNGRHSANECRAMWNVFLHPDINKGKWKRDEDNTLKVYAEEHNFQNWDQVALDLKTKRSGYQCFIRFNTNFKNNMFNRISSWSKEEDQKLTDTVNALRTGNFIPWGEVAKLMGNRRKQQIYMRWNYSLAPNLKKGRFTEEENKLLLEGVAKFGSNFTKISVALLPHRNTAQLNDHYRTLMSEKKNYWSCEDDIKLIKLFDKFGNNWSAIAKEFSNKSRVQVRHRHTAIIRYLSRGLSIRTIPRWTKKNEETNTTEDVIMDGEQILDQMSKMLRIQQAEKEVTRREKISKIDLRLKDYFKAIYQCSSKPGRTRKYYSSEKLDETTQKLHVILNMLNADLQIPDKLDRNITSLSEKDKQLLNSLKAYSIKENLNSEARQKHIEYIRRKMFGSSMPLTDEERFIPPLPFDGQVQRCKKKVLVGMNYVSKGDKYLVEVPTKLNTPEAIISLIGGWESEIEFQNLEKIFLGKTKNSLENSSSRNTRTENRFNNSIDLSAPSTSSGIVNSESMNIRQKTVTTGINQLPSQTIREKPPKYYPETLIPPNYVTLLGFRGILLTKHILEAENSDDECESEEECTLTPEGQKALDLFEDRLVKLFKFPIELSEIPPPLLHGLQDEQFDDMDNVMCTKKRKSSKKNSGLETTKKTKLETVPVKEILETE